MKNGQIVKNVIRAAVFYFTFAGLCQTIHAQAETRFRLAHETVIIVSLTANGGGPFDFVLDTGTDTSIVDPSVAQRLALVPMGQIEINTLSGVQTLPRCSLRILAIGPARAENVEVLVQDLSELRKLDSHIQGIVGQNFLSHFNYLLDYRKHTLRTETGHEIGDSLEGEPVHIERRENMMIVPAAIQSQGTAKIRLLLDSGANLVVLTRKSSQAMNQANRQNWLKVTSGGQDRMQVGLARGLAIGSQQFRDVVVALPETQLADAERVEDGLLPTSLFKSFYVNNREGFVVFNPRPKKNEPVGRSLAARRGMM